MMARFLRLQNVVLNLDTIACIRPLSEDAVTVVTAFGYTENLEGEDAIALLSYIFREAIAPVSDIGEEQLAHAWLSQPRGAFDMTDEWED